MAFCTNCGVELVEGVKFCGNCGQAVNTAPSHGIAFPRKLFVMGIAVLALGITIVFFYKSSAVKTKTVYSVDLDSPVKLGTPISFGNDGSLYNELQWLAARTACIGIYNQAQMGDWNLADPQDYYKPSDIREFLTERSGEETKTDMFYGVCFNYAQAAYDDIFTNVSRYTDLGLAA
jgi:hypothetical protein